MAKEPLDLEKIGRILRLPTGAEPERKQTPELPGKHGLEEKELFALSGILEGTAKIAELEPQKGPPEPICSVERRPEEETKSTRTPPEVPSVSGAQPSLKEDAPTAPEEIGSEAEPRPMFCPGEVVLVNLDGELQRATVIDVAGLRVLIEDGEGVAREALITDVSPLEISDEYVDRLVSKGGVESVIDDLVEREDSIRFNTLKGEDDDEL